MTVFDLEHLELAYAPPFGAAKDPVNIAGYVAANRLRGDSQVVGWRDVVDRDPDKAGVLDVRTEVEWELGHVPGAVHIDNTELRGRLSELDPAKTWYLYCAVGRRAYVMERMLRQRGYDVRNISGGYTTFAAATEKQDNMDEPFGTATHAATLPTTGENGVPEGARAGAIGAQIQIAACGLQCPGPILQVYKKMQELHEGDVLEVLASDPGFKRDVAAWCERTGNQLLGVAERADGVIVAQIRKGQALPATVAAGRRR
jgi:TusA-related sulfurtransferase/rhodanese-related sulfurtransferase